MLTYQGTNGITYYINPTGVTFFRAGDAENTTVVVLDGTQQLTLNVNAEDFAVALSSAE